MLRNMNDATIINSLSMDSTLPSTLLIPKNQRIMHWFTESDSITLEQQKRKKYLWEHQMHSFHLLSQCSQLNEELLIIGLRKNIIEFMQLKETVWNQLQKMFDTFQQPVSLVHHQLVNTTFVKNCLKPQELFIFESTKSLSCWLEWIQNSARMFENKCWKEMSFLQIWLSSWFKNESKWLIAFSKVSYLKISQEQERKFKNSLNSVCLTMCFMSIFH